MQHENLPLPVDFPLALNKARGGQQVNLSQLHGIAPVQATGDFANMFSVYREQPAPVSSTCVGDEQNVVQCFRQGLGELFNFGKTHIRKAKEAPCKNKLLVACAHGAGGGGGDDDDDDDDDDDGDSSKRRAEQAVKQPPLTTTSSDDSAMADVGTWVVGDRIDPAVGASLGPALPNWWALRDNVISLVRPTIFRETEPMQCRVPDFMGNHWSDYAPAQTNCTWSRRVPRGEI